MHGYKIVKTVYYKIIAQTWEDGFDDAHCTTFNRYLTDYIILIIMIKIILE